MPEEKLGLQQTLSKMMAMPRDVVLDLPRITLLGNLQCCVENHHGILQIWWVCRQVNIGFTSQEKIWLSRR